MWQFTLKALLGTVLVIAVVLAVLFAVPAGIRILALFVGILALPAPLVTMFLSGNVTARSFATGSLIAYAAWFIIVGIPGGFQAITYYSTFMVPVAALGTPGTVPGYFLFAGLYAPWIVVIAGGLLSVTTRTLVERSSRPPQERTVEK
jgi:hypothetical protein